MGVTNLSPPFGLNGTDLVLILLSGSPDLLFFSLFSNEPGGVWQSLDPWRQDAMSMLTLIFVASFVSLAIVCTAIAWAIHARAELSAWRRTYRKLTEAENYAAWRNNRQMMMQ